MPKANQIIPEVKMSLYALGDPHLSLAADKPMDVFGGKWENYLDKLTEGFSKLTDRDTCVLCGDISWAMNLDDALDDFKYLDSFPGKKIIVKGNHDYWWSTVTKIKRFFQEHDITTIDILFNNCFFYADVAICGTRGWFYEEEKSLDHDKKILVREVGRLEASLKAAGDREKLCFLHYPPRYGSYVCPEVVQMLEKYNVHRCWYGHIHSYGQKNAVQGPTAGIDYRMVSADYVNFAPVLIKV
jgi:hypothetical protein